MKIPTNLGNTMTTLDKTVFQLPNNHFSTVTIIDYAFLKICSINPLTLSHNGC